LWKRTINGMMLMVFQQLNGQNFVRQMRAIVFVEDLR
jgi:hypothetical protein